MTTIRPRLGDESFMFNGTVYPFMFPRAGGNQGFVSASPFAPKSQIGERSYNDYTAYSVAAFTDLSGGMGQERIGEATKYTDAQNLDARSGQLVLGPLVHTTAAANLVNFTTNPLYTFSLSAYGPIQTEQHAFAAKITGAGQTTRHIWLPLKGALWGKRVTVEVWSNSAVVDEPDTLLEAGTINPEDILEQGGWACATLDDAIELTDNTIYWVAAWVDELPATISLPTELLSWYCWFNNSYYADIAAKRFGSDSWFTIDGYAPICWIPDESAVDAPLILLTGSGEDGVSRVWGAGGRRLYYMDEISLPVAVLAASDGDPKELAADAMCAAWYKAEADTAAFLYIGLGDDTDLAKFNGSIGDEDWPTITGVTARAMCLHDGLLYLANSRNKVQSWNTTTMGDAGEVGDSAYVIRNLVSWGGYVWAGKDDGLYRVVLPDGYPTTGTPEAQKVVDLSALASSDNFRAMCVHQDDLYFSVNQGIMRYTGGGVLSPVGPETGLELSADVRSRCRTLASSLTALWAGFEAPFDGYAAIMSYTDGAWHPLAQLARRGDLVRSLVVEPGWYGETPRIWFGSTICTSYMAMPLSTMRRWLWDLDDEYATNGHLYTSWIDGGLRTVTKDWISCDVDLVIPGDATDQFEVSLMYRTSEGGTWTPATVAGSTGYNSGAHTPGVSTFDFPAGSASARIQLRVAINYYRSVTTPGTARVQAIILKFMERPDDLQQFSRTYELSTYQAWRNGQPILDGLGERVGWLRTLREAKEPLVHTDWMGTARNVHIVDYRAAERPEVEGDKDTGTVTVSLRLQVV